MVRTRSNATLNNLMIEGRKKMSKKPLQRLADLRALSAASPNPLSGKAFGPI
jgi:hypothetical protein